MDLSKILVTLPSLVGNEIEQTSTLGYRVN